MAAAGIPVQLPDLQLLQKAIECGDVEKAKQIVSQLAVQKSNLKIEHQADRDLTTGEIDVKIYLEDKYEKPGGSLQWKVHPSISIKQLKERLEEEQNIPQQVQKWIIGKCIRDDTYTLASCGIKSSGASIYVYLLSASKVGLTREQFENRKNQPAAQTGIYDVPRDLREPGRPATQHQAADEPFEVNFQLDVDDEPVVHPHLEIPRYTEDILPSITQVGWRCPSCTLANEPTRPGCEMCGADRPTDYAPPQVGYKMTEREKKRLEKVEEEERLARELSENDPESLQVNLDSMHLQQDNILRNNVPDFAFGSDERINEDPLGTAGLLDGIDPLILQELVLDAEEQRLKETVIPESLAPFFTGEQVTRVIRGVPDQGDENNSSLSN